jgi:hypothetical protein
VGVLLGRKMPTSAGLTSLRFVEAFVVKFELLKNERECQEERYSWQGQPKEKA